MRIFVPAMGRVNTRNRDGSEVRFAEIAKEWLLKVEDVCVMLPEREAAVLERQGVKANFKILREPIKSEKDTLFNVLLIYTIRIVQSFFARYPDSIHVVYAPSDFLVDLIPAIICRIKNRRAKLIVCLFLIAPNPFTGYENVYTKRRRIPSARGVIYYITQKASILIIRLFHGKILVLNSFDKKSLVDIGMNKEDVFVVSMGVNFSEYDRVIRVPDAKPYDAIFVGRLHPQKGLFDLVKIWKIVCAKRPESKLAIIGGGSDSWFNQLGKEIKNIGLRNNIEMLGFKDGEEKIRLLKSARCFVMPSHYESWGMTAVEAMASGLPVVAYSLPIFREIFHQGMTMVNIGDINGFAEAILELLYKLGYRTRLAQEAAGFARRFDWSFIAEKELQIISAMSK